MSAGFDAGADVGWLATFSTVVGLAVATVVGLAFAAGVRLAIAAAVGVAVVPAVGIVTAVPTCVPTCGSSAPVTVAATAAVRLPWRSVAWIINVPSGTESGTVTRTPPNCPFWSAWTKVAGSTMSDTFCLTKVSTVAPRGKPLPRGRCWRPDGQFSG